MHQAPITRRATGAVWWSTLEITARYGVQFFVVLLLARLLAPSDFGLIAILLVFISIGTLLIDSGFSTALIQRQKTTADDEATVFWFTVGMSMLLFGTLWFSAPAIALFFEQPLLTPLLHLVAWILPISALSSVPDAILTQKLQFKARTKAQLISAIFSALVTITLAWRGFGVWSLAWQAVTAAATRGALLWLYSGWAPTGQFRKTSFHSLFGFGGYMLLSSLLDTLTIRLQSVLIGKLFDTRSLGYYTIAQSVQSAPTSIFGGILNRVGLPVFASVTNEPAKLAGALRLSIRVTLFIFIPCMVGIALIAKPLLEFFYGQRWGEAAPILTLLALSSAFWPLHVLNLSALSAQGHSNLFFRLEVMKKVIAITLILAFSTGGPVAIAGSVLISSLLGIFINTKYSGKLLGYGLKAQLIDLLPTIGLTALAAPVGWAILHWTTPGLFHLCVAVIATMATYIGAAIYFRNAALSEIVSLVQGFMDRSAPATFNPTKT